MASLVQYLWLIPFLPLLAAGIIAVTRQPHRRLAATLAIGAMAASCLISCAAFITTLGHGPEGVFRQTWDFTWLQIGPAALKLGWVLDPLTAIMAVMVTFVSTLIFIYSVGYMAHDQNFTRFFCFLSLFGAAMLGLVIANSLLLLFICWELVGLASYLLIGFWYHKPSAAAAAKKAFMTTRIGDVLFLLGIVWLYSDSGTLLFYDQGQGCLEQTALTKLTTTVLFGGVSAATFIGLLIFGGAVGKSGQVPLHVWLPDAMEGPTPVSALIHAATMVAAGVFLVARVYPLMSAGAPVGEAVAMTPALQVITWVGAITAVFAATIAVAQNDIKRILAYSTVSQLGYMFLGLGVGGVAVGMFHLITHAFFKALLFLGSGSVIHGCEEEQDIRRMGGLRRFMPVTFATYAIGMMALSGVPLVFSGFWSKDEILHAAHAWPASIGPFLLGLMGALLTAFYMTRQICYVFFGKYRGAKKSGAVHAVKKSQAHDHEENHKHAGQPHESPRVMTVPLSILAVCAVLLGFLGTPAWPWFQTYLGAHHAKADWGGILLTMLLSTAVVAVGLGMGWRLYGRRPVQRAEDLDVLEQMRPEVYNVLRNKYFVDEFYEASVLRLNRWWTHACDFLDQNIWNGLVTLATDAVIALSWLNRFIDEFVINLGFDQGCRGVRGGGRRASGLQDGQVQSYLRLMGVSLAVLVLMLAWGCGK